jgi:hypothetical protein
MVARLLGGTLILVAVAMLARSTGLVRHWRLRGSPRKRRNGYAWTLSIGALLGFLVGVTSVGSGTLFGVAMLVVFGMGAKEMVGTDIYHAAILTSAAACAHLVAGNVDYSLVGSLLIGAIPGVIAGSRFATRMPEKALRPTLAVVLLLSGIKMI